MAQKKRFYVTLTWDDWPEGGSYCTVVEASDHEEAEELARNEMADSAASDRSYEDEPNECTNCGNTDQDGSDICPDCGGTSWKEGKSAIQQVREDEDDDWHLVDCFDLDEFIAAHTKTE